jgi:hypothetical protein
VVSIENAEELLNLSPNYVKSLRGKALKTAAKSQNQITNASIKHYKSRQKRHPQSAKGESIEVTLIEQASGS